MPRSRATRVAIACCLAFAAVPLLLGSSLWLNVTTLAPRGAVGARVNGLFEDGALLLVAAGALCWLARRLYVADALPARRATAGTLLAAGLALATLPLVVAPAGLQSALVLALALEGLASVALAAWLLADAQRPPARLVEFARVRRVPVEDDPVALEVLGDDEAPVTPRSSS